MPLRALRLLCVLSAILLWIAPADAQTIRPKQIIMPDGQGAVLKLPSLTIAQRDASTHRTGDTIYCSDCSPAGVYFYFSGSWHASGAGGAGTVTNTGTLTANAFILGNGGVDVKPQAITGLVLGQGASAPAAYAGSGSCSAGDFISALDASGAKTCGTPAGGGAPTDATYITQTPHASLSAEQALSALGTGLMFNTTTTGVVSIYAGSTPCSAGDFVSALSAAGVATCGTPAGSGTVTASGTPLIHQIPVWTTATNLTGIAVGATGTYFRGVTAGDPVWSTLTLPNTVATGDLLLATGTNVVTVLADAATGNVLLSGGVGVIPAYGKADLTAHVTGVLPVANGGTGASTLLIHGVLLGNTTSAVTVTAVGATGTVFAGVTGADPAFTATPTVTSVTTAGQGALVIGPYGGGAGNTGELRFLELTGGNYRGFKAADALTGNLIWTLPAADGASGECLATSGSGVLSWGACSAGSGTGITSLGGLNGAVQSWGNDTNVTMVPSGTTHTLTWVGTLAVARGGTGAGTLTSHGVLLGNTTSAVTATAEGATGTVLQGSTGNPPAFTATPSITGLTTTGQAALVLGPFGVSSGETGEARFLELTGGNYVALKAPNSITSNVVWTLPAADGTNLQCVTTNGSGTLQFSTCNAAAAPVDATYLTLSLNGTLSNERVATVGTGISIADGGANSTATFSVNQATAFAWTGSQSWGGATGMTWDNTNKRLGVGTQVSTDANGAIALNVQGAPDTDVIAATDGTRKFGLYIGPDGVELGAVTNHDLKFYTNNTGAVGGMVLSAGGGLQLGLPADGNKGSGTINVSGGYYVNGALLSANPGGSTTQVQFNNAGVFGGDSTFVWDNTNKNLAVGGGTYSAFGDDDASAKPVSGLFGLLGSAGSGNTTGAGVALFQKFSNNDITVAANAVVKVQHERVGGTGVGDSRIVGLLTEVVDQVGWNGAGSQAFAGAGYFKAIGVWPAGRQGSVQPLTLNAIVRSPATNFGFVNGLEIGTFNNVVDKGFRTIAQLQGAPSGGALTIGQVNFAAGTFPIDVGYYVGNPYGGTTMYHGLLFRDANIATGGNYISATNFSVTKTGQMKLTGDGAYLMTGGLYTQGNPQASTNLTALTAGSTATKAHNQGSVAGAWYFFDNNEPVGVSSSPMQVHCTYSDTTTGHTCVSLWGYTSNNTAENSTLLVGQTGPGDGLVAARVTGLRPAGKTDWGGTASTSGWALETFTDADQYAVLATAGFGGGPRTCNFCGSMLAFMDTKSTNAKGILVMPGDGVFDTRQAYAVGTYQFGAADSNIKNQVLLNGNTGIGGLADTGATAQLKVYGSVGAGTNIWLAGTGGATPSKYLRAFNSVFEVLNNAYSAPILQITDAGAATLPALGGLGNRTVCVNNAGTLYTVASGASC